MPDLNVIASQVRRDIIRMVAGAQSGHPGGALGCADLLTVLYFDVLRHDPARFTLDGEGQDVFLLSNGHLSALWYSVLARSGYFSTSELGTFRKLNTRLQGHPTTFEKLPGVRMSSGSLGQGLSVACGTALAKKMNQDPYLVYVLMGDGELQEGQVWEAALFAPARKIDNLIAIVDYNHKQIDGPVEEVVTLGDLHAKWAAFGWKVLEMNGNNIEDVQNTLKNALQCTGKQQPVIILMHTEMGFGVDFMTGNHKWHGVAPNPEQAARALEQLKETLGDY